MNSPIWTLSEWSKITFICNFCSRTMHFGLESFLKPVFSSNVECRTPTAGYFRRPIFMTQTLMKGTMRNLYCKSVWAGLHCSTSDHLPRNIQRVSWCNATLVGHKLTCRPQESEQSPSWFRVSTEQPGGTGLFCKPVTHLNSLRELLEMY